MTSLQLICRFGQRFIALGLILITATILQAQPLSINQPKSAPTRPEIFLTSSDGSDTISLKIDHPEEIALHLKNTSTSALTITHVGINSAAIFTPITPLTLKPDETGEFKLLIDAHNVPLPGQLALLLRVHDEKGERVLPPAMLALTSKDILLVQPRQLAWKSGDEPTAKTAKIVNLPSGVKVTDVKASNPQFKAELSGDQITITPTDTSKPGFALVTLVTEPKSPRLITIQVAIFPKPLAPPPPSINAPPKPQTSPPVSSASQ